MTRLKENFLNYLTLFSSTGTLICCTLPVLLVSLGLGAVMAGLAGNIPGLIWLSENKAIVFTIAAAMLVLNGLLMWKNRNAPCPIDPKLRDACIRGRSTSKKIYYTSVVIFATGVFFAFIAPNI